MKELSENIDLVSCAFDLTFIRCGSIEKQEAKGEEMSMKKEVMVDMTSGRIAPQILRFAMPVLLGLVFQRIYNFADSYIVGHFLGDNALAAVSVAGVGMYLVFSLIIGLTTGVTVVMSQYYGAKEEDKVVKTFFSSIFIALGMTILVTVIGLLMTRPLLIVLQTPAEVLDAAVLYLRIICAGSVGTMLYNWISAVLRSLGNSVVPLIFLGISSLLNIVFDILFVAVIPMGVGGAAFATVLAQVISGVACLLYAWKILPMLRIRRDKLKLDTYIGKQMLVYGLPAALQIKAGFRTTFLLNAIGYAVVSPLIFLLAPVIMRMFTESQEAIGYGVEYMHIFAPFLIGVGTLNLFHNMLRAVGDVKITIWMGISEVITRIGFAFLFSCLWGYWGLWWVSPITWWCAAGLGGLRYLSGVWKKKIEPTIPS